MNRASQGEACILVAAGARATEALLLECLAPFVEAARTDWRLLATPVRIVVPSRSLRDHVSATLVGHFGVALAGVQVQTLHGLARDILVRSGRPARLRDALLPILIREEAAREPILVRGLGTLKDGFGAVTGAVRDLLDAGLEPVHADGAEEALAMAVLPAEARERAQALVRVAGRTGSAAHTLGLALRPGLLRGASDAVLADPERALAASTLLVHGFADATGMAAELLQALVRSGRARVLLDEPPDPADPTLPDLGRAFSERLLARLASTGAVARPGPRPPAPTRLHFVEAPGGDAEVRGVAARIRMLLDAGASPERIGVVARTLGPYASLVRTHFERLALPFSAQRRLGGLAATGRRVVALLDLLDVCERTPTDRWLDAFPPDADGESGDGVPRADLRMAFHTLGAARVEHVAGLSLDEILAESPALNLPSRHGLAVFEDQDGESVVRAEHRFVRRPTLEAQIERARRTRARLASWSGALSAQEHGACLLAFVRDVLGWAETGAFGALQSVLADLLDVLPSGHPIERASFLLLLRERCRESVAVALGGEGGGVQLLDAIEARGRTFEHLFVLGLNRDVFPRVILEDPLLADAARSALRVCLPDLAQKLGGFDEERYLFAQLLSASPEVTVSWQTVGDDGKERTPSALIERLRWAGCVGETAVDPPLWTLSMAQVARPAHEHAVLAALHGGRDAFLRVLPLAFGSPECAPALEACGIAAFPLARVRLAVLDAVEPRDALDLRLGPYFGFVGALRAEADPRRSPLSVTTLESLARCPWQTFVQRLLRIQPNPDALEALPALDAMHVGDAVHRTVEAIVRSAIAAGRESLEAAQERGACEVPWPEQAALRHLLEAQAREVLREDGIASLGLVRALADRALPMLLAVRATVWPPAGAALPLFGSEVSAVCALEIEPGRTLSLHFRADLAAPGEAGPVLMDLKTGAPISSRTKPATRRSNFLEQVASGERLQAVAYALGSNGEGQYVFVDPERDTPQPVFAVRHDDADATLAFETSTRMLVSAFDHGAFFPRLEEHGKGREPRRCEWCQVSEACLRGDSGARRRLRLWAQTSEPARPGAAAAALAAARRLFTREETGSAGVAPGRGRAR
jgi:hypothetical protein